MKSQFGGKNNSRISGDYKVISQKTRLDLRSAFVEDARKMMMILKRSTAEAKRLLQSLLHSGTLPAFLRKGPGVSAMGVLQPPPADIKRGCSYMPLLTESRLDLEPYSGHWNPQTSST